MHNSLDAIVVRVKVPQDVPEQNEERIREINSVEEEENMCSVVLNAYAVQSQTQSKRIEL